MKVSQVLTESGRSITEVRLDFNELTSIQIGALRAIGDGRLDFDNATDRMMDVLYELQDLNLLNSVFELTPTGDKAVSLASKLGGSAERRKAASKKKITPDDDLNPDDVYDDDYGGDIGYDDEDMSEFQPNRFGAPPQHI